MSNEKDTKSETKALADAIGEAIRANRPQGPLEQAGFSAEQIKQLTDLPKPKKWREVACKSEETGATFIACVVESKSMPNGRIIQLKSYAHPQGAYVFQKDGGLVPDGLQVLRAGMGAPSAAANGDALPKHDFNPFYLQWRWQEFYKRDLKQHVSSELKKHHAIDQAAFTTPWQEGHVRAEEAS